MPQKFFSLISIATALALLLSACGGSQPTPDAAAISTAAAQTVEARFTQQAAASTATPLPPTGTPTPAATATQELASNATQPPAQATTASNGKPCYTMTFLADITIPDGMIVAPGTQFVKTWRVRNDGNCPWDQKYSLVLDKGDALSTITTIPLTRVVNPGDSLDISLNLTAPTTEGQYAGYWHILTPYGGYMGVGSYNQSLAVQINVTSRPDKNFGISSVVMDWSRTPPKGCGSDGAVYSFTATITANAPGEIDYRWDRNPFDGSIVHGVLKFDQAGSKTVNWSWAMTNGHIQGIDRSVWITTIVGTKETAWTRVVFNFTCNTP